MARIKGIELSDAQHAALEHAHRHGPSHAFRQRCGMVLLKSQGLASREVVERMGGCEVVVNRWLERYRQEGLAGLQTRGGRGRKPILDEGDLEAVRTAVAQHRQRLSVARAELETALGKNFCQETLSRFVKKTVVCISECENVPDASRTRSLTSTKPNA